MGNFTSALLGKIKSAFTRGSDAKGRASEQTRPDHAQRQLIQRRPAAWSSRQKDAQYKPLGPPTPRSELPLRLLGFNELRRCAWLGNLDSNQDKQSQSLLCYRYTIPQFLSKIMYLCQKPAVAAPNP